MDPRLKILIVAATIFTGLLTGASLDQSIKQLPARHLIGLRNFSSYAKAADLKNGIVWYAILGIGSALTTVATVIVVWRFHSGEPYAFPVYTAGVFAIGHTICTTQAAPTYLGQKKVESENELKQLFDKFERIQTVRSVFVVLNFIALLWAISLCL